jgi:hypothetical protein
LLLQEDANPNDLPLCDYASFTDKGISVVQKGVLQFFNTEFEKISEIQLEAGVKRLFSCGY